MPSHRPCLCQPAGTGAGKRGFSWSVRHGQTPDHGQTVRAKLRWCPSCSRSWHVIDAQFEYGPNKTVRVIGVHPIANPGLPWEVWRYWEARHVARLVSSYQNERCLLAGDLNAIAPGEGLQAEKLSNWHRRLYALQGSRAYHFSISLFLAAGLVDCYRSLHADEGFTIPPPDPIARLDYIFANPVMRPYLHECRVVREPESVYLASDHYPVMAEFSFDH